MRNSRLGEVEERVNVGVESVKPMFRRKFGDLRNRILVPVVADESIELIAEVVQVLLNDSLAYIFLGQVGSEELKLA